MTSQHHWIRGGRREHRARLLATLGLPEPVATIDAHRRLRGPYTGGGALMRAIVPAVVPTAADLVRRHDIEIRTTAPELADVVPGTRETLTSLAVPSERTRFYSRLRTLRIAHGLVEFVRDLRRAGADVPAAIVFENVEHADPTDAELIAVMLRRLAPGDVTVVVCAGAVELGPTVSPEPLSDALDRHCVRHDVPGEPGASVMEPAADGDGATATLAAVFIDGDGTADDPALIAAYDALDAADRAILHDRRAAELQDAAEPSLLLGAIPWHREHGSDPAGAGADALRHTLEHCIDMGFYDATIDAAQRGRRLIDPDTQIGHWWAFTTKMTTSLAIMSRTDEAQDLYTEVRARTTSAVAHRQAAYATAMLYTRHHEDDRKDHQLAKAWINTAIALAELDPDPDQRTFASVFNRNGLALIEVHLKNLPRALELVDDGLARLDRELGADKHHLHRSVLLYNRAQVHAGMGELDEAYADYTAVIALDPNYPEYHFDRGSILRRLGRPHDALADYRRAMQLSPPFPEVHYNYADTLLELGDADGALASFDYVLELEPGNVDALINRAGLLTAVGETRRAAADVDAGLALAPDNPHLWALRGQLLSDDGAVADALAAYDRAIEHDPALAGAWASRGALRFEAGDVTAAITDLDRAATLNGGDPQIRFNYATALQAAGRHADAVVEYDVVIAATDDPDAHAQREECLALIDGGSGFRTTAEVQTLTARAR